MSIAPMKTKVDEWERMIDINIKGVLYGIAAALPIFKKQESGHFINLSSAAGVKVFSPEEQFTAVLNLQLVLS
jgi:NADP-dependent 3-hydroxy acid dehydrogenase YdfG